MSIINAILFYSKKERKSFTIKKLIDEYNIDVETICVDNSEIKNMLLEDDKYNIKQVPTVLIMYSSGEHMVYKNKKLDRWLEELIYNVELYKKQKEETQTPYISEQPSDINNGYTNIINNEQEDMSDNYNGAQQAMLTEHIVGAKPINIESEPINTPTMKEVKKPGLSASEIARKMEEQREKIDDDLDKNKPLI